MSDEEAEWLERMGAGDETEAHLHTLMAETIGPNTKLHIDPRLKS